jgi:hypothetical protein
VYWYLCDINKYSLSKKNKSVEKKLGKIDILASKVDSLALDIELLKLKVLPDEVKESNTLIAIHVRIYLLLYIKNT